MHTLFCPVLILFNESYHVHVCVRERECVCVCLHTAIIYYICMQHEWYVGQIPISTTQSSSRVHSMRLLVARASTLAPPELGQAARVSGAGGGPAGGTGSSPNLRQGILSTLENHQHSPLQTTRTSHDVERKYRSAVETPCVVFEQAAYIFLSYSWSCPMICCAQCDSRVLIVYHTHTHTQASLGRKIASTTESAAAILQYPVGAALVGGATS